MMFELITNEKFLKEGVMFFTKDGEEWHLRKIGEKNEYNGIYYHCILDDVFGNVFLGDVFVSKRGTILNVRSRELLSNKINGHYVDRDELVFVSPRVRKALGKYFEGDEIVVNVEKDNVVCFEKTHYLHCHGGFFPYVSKGTVVVPDYNMSGTNYFLLTEEDVAWFEHDMELKLF